MSIEIVLAIFVSSIATYSSRVFGVITSEKINENSKIYRWFNCLAYSTLAALIARVLIFPNGALDESSYLARILVVLVSIFIFYFSKKNLVYPTITSSILLAFLLSI